MFSSKAIAVQDPEILEFIANNKFNQNPILPAVFVEQHRQWLKNDTFKYIGLDQFDNAYITAGCTEAFNEVYREPCYVLPGEYSYHRDAGMAIESRLPNIPYGSRLIISYPFAATGNAHMQWNDIVEHCKAKNIKIFVDACLTGVATGEIDLRHSCITHIAFSFSKAFYTGHFRTGVVYTKDYRQSPASVLNKHLYLNFSSINLHKELMENYSSQYVFQKYRPSQCKLCLENDLVVSDSVIFGLDMGARKALSPFLEILEPSHLY